MRLLKNWSIAVFLLLGLSGTAAGCGGRGPRQGEVRVGFFPNLTHAQALLGIADGSFQKNLGENTKIKTFVFNAGPSVIEAFFANELDLATIGPSPAINGYVKSKGTVLRIVAGSASGGAVLVVQPEANIRSSADFHGRRVATPQLGNTQDVAFRHYLLEHGLLPKEKGGTVEILPMQNADILTAFVKKEIDAAWVPEPWGARLVLEGKGAIFLDERVLWPDGKFLTACVIVHTEFLKKYPELVEKWLANHINITDWIKSHPEEAKAAVNKEIERHIGKPLKEETLNQAWSRLEFTFEPLEMSVAQSAKRAFALGFLGKEEPDLSGIYDLTLLKKVLSERK